MKEVALRNRIDIPSGDDMSIRQMITEIRANLNGLLFANSEKKMLPYWAIVRTWESGRRVAVPKYFPNDTHRNWTLIGTPGGQNFAISDSHGLTTVLESCGSIEFWPKDSDIIYPALMDLRDSPFKLVSIEDQIYEWSMSIGSINFQRLVYHVTKGDAEYIINEINLQNVALESKDFTFIAALRPISVWGAIPISKMSYDQSTGCLYSNDYLAMKLDRVPNALIMTTFDDFHLEQLVLEERRIDSDYSVTRGTGTAIARFDIKLRPAGRERLVFASPLLHMPRDIALTESSSSYGLRESAIAGWFDFTDECPYGQYPDEELSKAAAQATVSMVVQTRRNISTLNLDDLVKQSGEISRIILAIARSGFHTITQRILVEFVSKFKDTDISSKDVLALAPIIWVIHEIERSVIDKKMPEDVLRFKEKAYSRIKEIILECREPAKETLEEVPATPTGQLESEFNDIPSIESIQAADSLDEKSRTKKKVTLYELLERYWFYLAGSGLQDKSEELITSLECYQARLSEDAREILATKPWDYESIDDFQTILEMISACTLSKDFIFIKELFASLVGGIREKRFFKGLVRYPGKAAMISSHYALRIAHAFVLLGTRHEAELILAKISEYLSSFHYLPDYIDPKTRGGTYGSGCSLKAAADLKLLLRDMMLYERGDDLYVFPGIPEDWFTSEESLSVDNIPTRFGTVSLATGVSANQHQIEIQMENLPEEMEVFLPAHIPLHMVKVFGGTVIERYETPNNRIRLVPLSDQIAITFHRL